MAVDWKETRRLVERNVRIWPFWDEGGNYRLLLQMVQKDGSPGATIGSCKLSEAEEKLPMMMRGLEIGVLIGQGVEV